MLIISDRLGGAIIAAYTQAREVYGGCGPQRLLIMTDAICESRSAILAGRSVVPSLSIPLSLARSLAAWIEMRDTFN